MTGPARVPPRFVPTLTTVLELPPEPVARRSELGSTTELGATVADPPSFIAIDTRTGLMTDVEAFRLEEQLLHRVLQRVDLSLEEQLSDAVSAAVQHQLDEMIPRLRREIEGVLRALVIEALAQELSDNPGSTPPAAPQGLG